MIYNNTRAILSFLPDSTWSLEKLAMEVENNGEQSDDVGDDDDGNDYTFHSQAAMDANACSSDLRIVISNPF